MSQKGLFASVSGWPNIERKNSPKSDFGTEELGGRDHTHSPATTHTYIYIHVFLQTTYVYIYIYLFIYSIYLYRLYSPLCSFSTPRRAGPFQSILLIEI